MKNQLVSIIIFLMIYRPHLNKMIAGDIKIEDILKFKNKDFIIDISGSLENNEGKKDIKKINNLLNLVKKYEIKKKNSSN